MSLHVLSAGTGYLYYTSQVASADELRDPARALGDYYSVHGNAPGQWVGSNLEALGLSGQVSEKQMENLFGSGIHPEAERIISEKVAAGYSLKEAERAAKLGARYYEYGPKKSELAARVQEEYARFERVELRAPTALERRALKVKQAAVLFHELHGRAHASKEELGKFISVQLRPQQAAVAGFDLTFTPVKSISVLWALGGEQGRNLVQSAHEQAIAEALKYLERHGIATRAGRNGIAQVDVPKGIVASSFRHHDSRLGDPNLHNHVTVSNKVQDANGHWKSIDSKLLHRIAVTVSEVYNTRIQELLEDRGAQFEARVTTPGKQPIMELKAIPQELNNLFSQRSESMREIVADLVEDYTDRHGRAPDKAAMLKLMQTANLQTRPDKAAVSSLAEQVAEWTDRAEKFMGARRLHRVIEDALTPVQHKPNSVDVDVADAASEIVETISDKRSTWTRQNVMAEAQRWAREYGMEHGHVPAEVVDAVVNAALSDYSLSLTPTSIHPTFQALSREDGSSVFVHRTDTRYTSERILQEENLLLSAADQLVIPAATHDVFDTVSGAYNERNLATKGFQLGEDQLAFARELATSPRLLTVGIGPAGAGKTTAMDLLRETVEASGHKVLALSPSAVAAAVLGESIHATAVTTDLFLTLHDKGLTGGGKYASLDVGPGDMILVDEAGQQGTAKLAHVIRLAQEKGAIVRLVGDDYQMGAVQAGGALRLLVAEKGAVELENVQRFRNADGTANLEEAAASLALRTPVAGEEDPWKWYRDHDRIVAGDPSTMESMAFTQWQQHVIDGDEAVIIAPNNELMEQLNLRAQSYRIHAGEVDPNQHGVTLRDGAIAYPGDQIATRQNKTTLKTSYGHESVKNGDTWRIRHTHADGSLSVEHLAHGGRVRLPAEYVRAHTHLGYAINSTRVQGLTTLKSVALLDEKTARNTAYVMATRGSRENGFFVITENGKSRDDVLAAIAANHGIEETAHEALQTEHARVDGTPTLFDELRYITEKADEQRFANLARDLLGTEAEAFIKAESWGAVAAHLARAEREGFDLDKLFLTAHNEREFQTADDKSAVLAWRIERHMDEAPELIAKAGTRPLAGLTDEQLAAQLAVAEQREARAQEIFDAALAHRRAENPEQAPALAVPSSAPQPGEAPHWSERPFGRLSDAQLEERITQGRYLAREATAINDPDMARKMAGTLRGLKAEQKIRDQELTFQRRAAENYERGPRTRARGDAGALAGHKDRYFQSRTIAAQLRAEQRLRDLTPGHTEAPQAPDRVPEWLAPSRALNDRHLPADWRKEIQTRRELLAQRFEERGHLIAAEEPAWSKNLGPVPADPERAQRWRDTAAEVEAFRARYNIPETETTPIPATFREQTIGKELHEQVVAVSRSSHASTDHVSAVDRTLDGLNALSKAVHTHAAPSQAQQFSDAERARNEQAAMAITEQQRARARMEANLNPNATSWDDPRLLKYLNEPSAAAKPTVDNPATPSEGQRQAPETTRQTAEQRAQAQRAAEAARQAAEQRRQAEERAQAQREAKRLAEQQAARQQAERRAAAERAREAARDLGAELGD